MKKVFVAILLLAFPLVSVAELEPKDQPGPQDNPAGGAIKVQDKVMNVDFSSGREFNEKDLDDPEIDKEARQPIKDIDPSQVELTPRDLVTDRDLLIGSIAGTLLGYGVGHAIQKRYYDGYGYAYTISEGVGYVLLAAGFGDCGFTESNCDNKNEGLVSAGAILYIGARLAEIFDVWYYYGSNKDSVARDKKTQASKKSSSFHMGLAPSSQGMNVVMGLTF